jgi:hypothetical protein
VVVFKLLIATVALAKLLLRRPAPPEASENREEAVSAGRPVIQ